jgi:cytidyltransferase-like protein
MKKVFVSGCFDLLHSGHIAFFEEASQYGDVYVGLGSDKTVYDLKCRKNINSEKERLYMVKSVRFVKDAWINKGSGLIDFEEEIKEFKPDIFFVNEDGHSKLKEDLCKDYKIEYVISKRIPKGQLPKRSTTSLRQECTIPYRIDLAGGWLDQPFVSKYFPGSVITISIEPEIEFNNRSGMASSTRYKAIELWHNQIPEGDKEKLAKILFCYDNPPSTEIISGSQDSLGIVLPWLNKLEYNGGYWPFSIKKVLDEDILSWLESKIYLVSLSPRIPSFNVLENTEINKDNARNLALAAESTWKAILEKDLSLFAQSFTDSFEAQVKMFPNMVNKQIREIIDQYKKLALGWKISGAGGGGYLIFISEQPIVNAFKIKIRRE